MKEIQNTQLLEHYLSKYHIRSLFENPNLPFQHWEYEQGGNDEYFAVNDHVYEICRRGKL